MSSGISFMKATFLSFSSRSCSCHFARRSASSTAFLRSMSASSRASLSFLAPPVVVSEPPHSKEGPWPVPMPGFAWATVAGLCLSRVIFWLYTRVCSRRRRLCDVLSLRQRHGERWRPAVPPLESAICVAHTPRPQLIVVRRRGGFALLPGAGMSVRTAAARAPRRGGDGRA